MFIGYSILHELYNDEGCYFQKVRCTKTSIAMNLWL